MEKMGWLGEFGFYESADYSVTTQHEKGSRYTLVRSWMAHHQGMSLLAITNLLAGKAFSTVVPQRSAGAGHGAIAPRKAGADRSIAGDSPRRQRQLPSNAARQHVARLAEARHRQPSRLCRLPGCFHFAGLQRTHQDNLQRGFLLVIFFGSDATFQALGFQREQLFFQEPPSIFHDGKSHSPRQ